jgi:hypothetical protein
MQEIDGGGWLRETIKIVVRIIELLEIGEAQDEFTDGFSDGYNSVEPWKP